MSTFAVAMHLREDRGDSERVLEIANFIAQREGLGCGGGGEPEGPVVLCVQRNAVDGALVPVTEDDRSWVRRALADHPNVARFVVGPILPEGLSGEAYHRADNDLLEALRRCG